MGANQQKFPPLPRATCWRPNMLDDVHALAPRFAAWLRGIGRLE
jgi:hypothetical protein